MNVTYIEAESTMPKKFKTIPIVSFEDLIKGHEQINADREEFGSTDATISLVRALARDHEPHEIMAISYRLGALARLIKQGEGKPWTFAITKEKFHLVNEALFRAAARAPLMEAKTVGDVCFEHHAFMKIALEESEAGGHA